MLLITKLNCVRACVRQAREDRQADTSGSSSDQSPTLCSCLYPEKGTWSRLVQKGCCVVSNPSADVATTVAGVATNSRCKQVSITLPRSLTCAQLPQRRAVSPNGGALKGCCSRTTLCYPPLSWNLYSSASLDHQKKATVLHLSSVSSPHQQSDATQGRTIQNTHSSPHLFSGAAPISQTP